MNLVFKFGHVGILKCKTIPKPECCSIESAVSERKEAVQTSSSARENSLYTCAGKFGSGCESGMMTL